MSFIFRSSARLVQCSNRMMHSLAKFDSVENLQITKSRKANSFRYILNSDLEIAEKLKNNEKIEDSQWIAARESLIKNCRSTETFVDSQIFDICTHFERQDEAAKYFKFLQRNNYKLNLNLIGNYFKTFYGRKTPLTHEEEEEIYRLYDDLRKKYPLLDGLTCSSCILALSLTKRWKESFELLEMMKIAARPGVMVMRSVICAAFLNKEPLLGWKMMNEAIQHNPLDHNVYLDFISYYKKNIEGDALKIEVEKMFGFWREHQVLLPEHVIKEYLEVYESFGHEATFTSVSKK